MIRIQDAATLALTKLRTRKVRLTVTIIVSGLLFSALAGASFAVRGMMGSIDSFGKEGLGDRYIVRGYPHSSLNSFDDPEILDRATAIFKDTVARKKTEAKRLGITYSAESDQPPVQEFEYPGGKQRSLNSSHPAAKQALEEYLKDHPIADKDTFTEAAKTFRALGTYEGKIMPFAQDVGELKVMKDGKETFETELKEGAIGPPTGTDSFVGAWATMSSELLKPFILKGQDLELGTDGSIPIIVPRSAAEQLVGLKELPASAKPAEQLERIKKVREEVPDVRFSACFRNTTSASLVQQAVSTKQEIEQNKGKKDYRQPDLVYGLPTEPCGAVPITRDVRNKQDKTLADKQRQFDELFGTPPAEQSTLSFRVVGIVPDLEYGGGAMDVGQIINSLVVSSLGPGWYSPIEHTAKNPLMNTLFNQVNIYSSDTYYAEFASASIAKEFIEKQSCTVDYSKVNAGNTPVTQCTEQNKMAFTLDPYGSNSLALDSAKRGFGKFFGIAALVVSGIACIIMMGTVGRMIADSRRETAVFRAIGAKKLDIAQIYVTYVICLSLLISLFALIVGLVLSLIAHSRWSAEATVQAITAYNAQDLDKTFALYSFHLPDVLMLVGLALAAGLLSAALPLFRNLRRNPIRDMRDDT